MSKDPMADWRYVGAGWFRLPGARGEATDVVHAPELVQSLQNLIRQSAEEAK